MRAAFVVCIFTSCLRSLFADVSTPKQLNFGTCSIVVPFSLISHFMLFLEIVLDLFCLEIFPCLGFQLSYRILVEEFVGFLHCLLSKPRHVGNIKFVLGYSPSYILAPSADSLFHMVTILST